MNVELENNTPLEMDTIVVTYKEYVLLNAVFSEYTNVITSKEFSLFSSDHSICEEIGKCQDNEKKLKNS